MTKKAILEKLEETRINTLPYFDLDEEVLKKTYQQGKWNIKYLLHHLADAETVLYERIRRVISEPKPVIWGFDPDKWALYLDYSTVPLSLSKKSYDVTRDAVVYYTNLYFDKYGKNEFIHNETGLRTLQDEIIKVAIHNEHHLSQIKTALNL